MKILWIGFIWPEPGSSAAGARTMQLITTCLQAGHEVTFCSASQDSVHRDRLVEAGIHTERFQPNDPAIDLYLKEYQPELVFFDRFMIEEQFAWRVRAQCPSALRILDTCDLHSLRRARQRKVEEGQSALVLADMELQSDDAMREISAIYRSDLSLIISDAEMALLQDRYHVPSELLEYCPLFYPTPVEVPGFDRRRNFVTIGNFNHAPNLDSYRILQGEIWPRIQDKLFSFGEPNSELHIYGAYPTAEFLRLDNPKSGFRVKGWAQNARATLSQYRVNLAPLRFGAGLKGKVADGWSVGTPCIATSIAAEGMCWNGEFGGMVEDSWAPFADKAVALYSERATWERAQLIGMKIITEKFGEKLNAERFIAAIEGLVLTGAERRNRNFVGAMLWHNLHRSTEYFSRWIAAKNQPGTADLQVRS